MGGRPFSERASSPNVSAGVGHSLRWRKCCRTTGIQPMHPTTIAKIEAGTRSVRINEAVGIAELFEISLDTLVGHPSGTGGGT